MKKIYLSLSATIAFIAAMQAQTANLNVTFQSQLTYGTHTCANICGYVDSLGNEYALVGVDNGMSIVDVTNPSSPVQVTQIPDVTSEWKEIKVFKHYAYVTTEGTGGALQIVDLRHLPATNLPYHTYTGDGAIAGQLSTIHALHIDTTKHYCYLYGANIFQGGAVVLDLNTDPYNPTYVGHYTNPQYNYVHDGYVDNDTLYAGHIYEGYMEVVDMTNKTNPVSLATQRTTTAFTHNTWLTNDHKYVFTTDENSNSYLTCYDIHDLNNIQETDKIQSQNPNSGSIVHNTHILNNWAVTSWYRDGFVITDITRPYNLVNVGWYDTYPSGSGNGFNGTWGVYPFLPSGTIVASNIEDGLFVFSPNYVRACYLEGTVRDSICNTPLSGVTVTISSVNVTDVSDVNGIIRTGTAVPGTYTVTFSKPGYNNYVMNNVVFAPAQLDTFNIKMFSPNSTSLTGNTVDASTTTALPNVPVLITDAQNTYNFISDASGNFNSCSVISNNYTVASAKWGYLTYCAQDSISPANPTQNIQLTPGYQDEFTFDLGWTVSSTATTGIWERCVPIGTTYITTNDANPGNDANDDCTNMCYVTGNGGGSASQDDVDNGNTILTSPVFDLSGYTNPWIHYERWFFNAGGTGTPNDSLCIRITDGTNTRSMEKVVYNSPGNSSWVHKAFRVSNYMAPGPNMQLIVYTADNNPGHLVEAGFDNFFIVDSLTSGIQQNTITSGLQAYPNPFNGSTDVHYSLDHPVSGNAILQVTDITGRIVMTQPITAQSGVIAVGENLRDGIYFVSMVNGSEVSSPLRLVKTK